MKEKIALRSALRSVGLDVGNRHINMLALSREASGLRLLDFASVDLGPRPDREEKLRQLKNIAREKGITALAVNIGVCGEAVVVRYIDLPQMSREEVAQALKYEAQQYIPFKMEEVIFDYHILEPLNSSRKRMRVLLVAAKKQTIREFIEFIQQAGLKPRLIDVNAFSLINCFQINGPKIKADDVYALVNLELDLVNVNILQGQLPYFTRDISLVDEALSWRQEKDKKTGLDETVRPLLANLIREIRLSIDYYESEFERQVQLIYLTGEGAKIPELISFFSEQLGREAKSWNPLQNLLFDSTQIDSDALKQTSAQLALACGLALRKL